MDGNTELLRKEVSKHLDELYNFALRMTGSKRKAEKLLLRIIEEAAKFYKYHEPVDIREWLLRISLTIYHRFYLVNPGKDFEKIDSEFSSIPPYTDELQIKDIFRKMDDDDITKLFSILPSELRLVITLRHVLGLGYDRIAELVDIPRGTVITRLNRGRKMIYMQIIKE
jgi:RNA polymerase sigma-70 factor, ECF subfamily